MRAGHGDVELIVPDPKGPGIGNPGLARGGLPAESLRRSTVDRSYYLGIGESAYFRLSNLVGSVRGDNWAPVFRELAEKFEPCVELLTDVREDRFRQSSDVVSLFEEWLRTGSERALFRLQEMGVLTLGGLGSNPTQSD